MKKRAARAVFENIEGLTSEDLQYSDAFKNLIKEQVPKAIEESFKAKKIFAPIFEINSTSNYVEIHRNHWVQALETCLLWYVEDEDYEACIRITNLVKDLQKKQRLYTKKQPNGE